MTRTPQSPAFEPVRQEAADQPPHHVTTDQPPQTTDQSPRPAADAPPRPQAADRPSEPQAADRPLPAPVPKKTETAVAVRDAATPPPPRKPRDPFFDNAKFLAILLVVAGHSIVDLRDVRLAHSLYLFVYTFHMPVFIVITGYFSRNFTFASGKARKVITNLGVPYVVFETAYSTYHWAVGHSAFEVSLLDPYYLTWFLMALFAWRLSTPVWQQIRWPIPVAVVISLLSGTTQLPGELEMNRTFGLVPFYVLGLFLTPRHFELIKTRTARVLGVITIAGGIAFTYLVADRRMTTEWVYWRSGNPTMHVDNLTGTAMRLMLLVAATVLVAAFLTLVPRRRTWFTGLGSATLYAYLLHGFLTKGTEYFGWYDTAALHTVPGVLGVAACGAVAATLLCTRPVRTVMHWALEPNMAWAFTALRRPKTRLYIGRRRAT